MITQQTVSFSLTDKILEVAGIIATLVLIVLPFAYYRDLPDEIPSHFGFRGTPDGFGNKGSIWALPIIGVLLYIGLSLLNYFVIVKNKVKSSDKYGDAIARENVLRLMQILKLILSASFAYMIWKMIRVSLGEADGLGIWFVPTFIVLMTFLPIVFLITSTGKSKK